MMNTYAQVLPWLMLLLGALPGCALSRVASAHPVFDRRPVTRCLHEARAVVASQNERFRQMQAQLAGTGSEPVRRASGTRMRRGRNHLRASGLPIDLFARFDGHWRGDWRGAPTEHFWWSLDPSTQLVLINEAGIYKRGINLVGSDGRICGIVFDPEGPRLHAGRYLHDRATLEWVTPHRLYRERVRGQPGTRRYTIEEHLLQVDLPTRTFAVYREVPLGSS